ncbi:MAG: mannitol dehydrogenase family protein [Pseudomonadota bacterium]
MNRLSNATLAQLPKHVQRPAYDRAGVSVGIVHLGIGAFHRAHLAAYVEACLAEDPSWGICGVSLRSAATRDALMPQDGLYTLGVQSAEGLKPQIIGAVKDVLVAPEQPEDVFDRLTDPKTKIVSLTVTEKGYCHDPATGRLNESHPDIAWELSTDLIARQNWPRTAIGWLWLGLMARQKAGVSPYAVLSCDNLPSNGKTVRQVLLDYAALKDPEMVEWADTHLSCPSTMVDRIVPATTDANREQIAAILGTEDAWPVVAEPFSQFVVEDNFPSGRPAWEGHGVTMTDDVEAFEKMKLRMLNGSHSTLAYLGYLAGYDTVYSAISDEHLEGLVSALMSEEILPTLNIPKQANGFDYRDQLLERFANPGLKHQLSQIAMDGSQKLPQRLLGTIQDLINVGQPFDRLALGVAAWMRYATGLDERGERFVVQDPLAHLFPAITDAARADASAPAGFNADTLRDGFIRLEAVFGTALPSHEEFRVRVGNALKMLCEKGARATIRAYSELR